MELNAELKRFTLVANIYNAMTRHTHTHTQSPSDSTNVRVKPKKEKKEILTKQAKRRMADRTS